MIEWSVYSQCLSHQYVYQCQSQPSKTGQGPLCHTSHFSLHTKASPVQYCSVLRKKNGPKNSNVCSFFSCQAAKRNTQFLRYEVTFAIYCKSSAPLYHGFKRVGYSVSCKTNVKETARDLYLLLSLQYNTVQVKRGASLQYKCNIDEGAGTTTMVATIVLIKYRRRIRIFIWLPA